MSITISSSRNHNIDLLRSIAMLMICIIHMNIFLESFYKIEPGREGFFYFSLFTESIGYIGVNLYGIITGYVCITIPWRLCRYIRLWLLVLFYTLLFIIVGLCLNWSSLVPCNFNVKQALIICANMLFGSDYWFFRAYTGLFFIIPLINPYLKMIDKKKFYYLLTVSFFLTCLSFGAGICMFENGYNMFWLLNLYIIGAFIKLHPPNIRGYYHRLLIIICLCLSIPTLFHFVGINPFIKAYASPVMLTYSVGFFLLVLNISIKSSLIISIITWFAPLTFSIYLIHLHPWCREILTSYVPSLHVLCGSIWLFPILAGGVLFLICAFIDKFRIYLFRYLKINTVSEKIANAIENHIKIIINYLVNVM